MRSKQQICSPMGRADAACIQTQHKDDDKQQNVSDGIARLHNRREHADAFVLNDRQHGHQIDDARCGKRRQENIKRQIGNAHPLVQPQIGDEAEDNGDRIANVENVADRRNFRFAARVGEIGPEHVGDAVLNSRGQEQHPGQPSARSVQANGVGKRRNGNERAQDFNNVRIFENR